MADASLALAYPARWWSFTSNVRGLAESFCGHVRNDAAFAQRVAMATHELLENAVKYSVGPESPIGCHLEVVGGQLRVRVENPTDPAHIDDLRQEHALVNRMDPLDLYLERMQSDHPDGASRLGLARIRYEGEAQLHLDVRGATVCVEAIFDLPEQAS